MLRTEVHESSMRSSNPGGEELFFAKNTLFCVILTTTSSHWASPCITDSLSHTTCVRLKKSSVVPPLTKITEADLRLVVKAMNCIFPCQHNSETLSIS